MGLINFIKKETRADTEDSNKNISKDEEVLLSSVLSVETIDRDKALEIPAVQASISMIASTISMLPIKLYKETEQGTEEVKDIRTSLLTKDTRDTLTAAQFWRAIVEDYFLGKGGYVYINREFNKVKSLHYVAEEEVTIVDTPDPIFKDYDIWVYGKKYMPFEYLKFIRKTKKGGSGRSLIDENNLMLQVAYATLKYERGMVKKGGNKRGFLKSENKLTDQAMNLLKNAFKHLYNNNEENVVVLNKGIDFKEASNTSVEMQLNENKTTNFEDIIKLFNIPVGMFSKNPTDSIEREFMKKAIMPILVDFEQSLDRDLLLESEKQNYYFAFDTKEMLRGNVKEHITS